MGEKLTHNLTPTITVLAIAVLSLYPLTCTPNTLDSILSLNVEDSTKASLLYTKAKKINDSDFKLSIKLLEQSLELYDSYETKNNNSINALSLIGLLYFEHGKLNKAIHYFEKEKSKRILYKDNKKLGDVYNNLGLAYTHSGLYKEALDNQLAALKIKEQLKDEAGIAGSYHNIALIYDYQKKYTKALENYKKSLKIKLKIGNKKPIANSYVNLGVIEVNINKTKEGLDYFDKAKKIYSELKDSVYLCHVLINEADAYNRIGDIENASKAISLVGKINSSLKNLTIKAYYHSILSELEETKLNYSLAAKYYKKTKLLFDEMGALAESNRCNKRLSDVYLKREMPDSAYIYLNNYMSLKDSLSEVQNKTIQANAEEKYESSQKEKEIEVKTLELKSAKLIKNFFTTVAIILIILLILLVQNIRSRIKNNKALRQKNEIITGQKQNIEKQQQNIIESIQYAEKIQQSFLVSEDAIKSNFPDSFIIHKPKDILSGDFYWYSQLGDLSIFAVVDCTGHGIPGALMSMLGNRLLNEIVNVNGETQPDQILKKLHLAVVNDLKQSDNSKSQDGMDLFLCTFNKKTNALKYAGARNKAYVVHNNKLTTLTTTQLSIGGKTNKETSVHREFELFETRVEQGSYLYMFSDGLVDQFGGPERKKFGSKRVRELLNDTHILKSKKKKKEIEEILNKWQANYEQIDDILIMGIKIS